MKYSRCTQASQAFFFCCVGESVGFFVSRMNLFDIKKSFNRKEQEKQKIETIKHFLCSKKLIFNYININEFVD